MRAVALFEAAKGLVILLAGFGLLTLVHHSAQSFAENVVSHLHLNPASRMPRILISLSERLTDPNLWLIAAGAVAYSAVRFAEAYGLWFGRRWAEWFAAISGALYVPFEVYEVLKAPNGVSAAALLINLLIVGFMAAILFRRRTGIASQ